MAAGEDEDGQDDIGPDADDSDAASDDGEDFGEDVERLVTMEKAEVRGWKELREQIKKDLAADKKRSLTFSQINQLLIIRNFATLRLKGLGWMAASDAIALQWHEGEGVHYARRVRALARHYQNFEQLPAETRGGAGHSARTTSLLTREDVRASCLQYLQSVKAGQVTPRKFQHELNTAILPALGVVTKQPLCERTSRRWLIKLGWRLSVVKKGVYMDGHERPDVVEYRKEFLVRMAEFERRMTHYEGPDLTPTPPVLRDGEKEVIGLFHDEASFHQNDESSRVWLGPGQTVLRKKGRGRITHVSGFICSKTGRLATYDEHGDVVEEARKIIYPGSNGDPWWDTEQLLAQIKTAIRVFEREHPDCVGLFIFDQSSAHAALPPDALRAFEMNKGDGGKQRKQRDTVIPDTNPDASKRGRIQKMTTPSGEQKGLERTLTERGFDVSGLRAKCKPVCPFESKNCCMARLLSQQDDFVNQVSMLEILIREAGHECIFLPKFHCELNPIEMYWGWCKYRYRQEIKRTFEDSKRLVLKYLDACPTDVIRRFINRSWRFMSAYRRGLTGAAATWAVKKQRNHRQVSEGAMMSIEAVLN
ncbi:hypothetical protein PENSPDRAFT_572631 [Peniophora sp. CONT]|nr:hypothetical protein PENSPDRAFT_572631 [Peniophora sp. CONT]